MRIHFIGGSWHGVTRDERLTRGDTFRVAELPRLRMPGDPPEDHIVMRSSLYHIVKRICNPSLGIEEFIAVHEDWLR